MAWELPQHMHEYIAPSIDKASKGYTDPAQWLREIYLEQCISGETTEHNVSRDIIAKLPLDVLLDAITEKTIEHGMTTNGGWEVYLHPWVAVPWCTKSEMQEWWAY